MANPQPTHFAIHTLVPSPLEGDVVFFFRHDLQGARATLRRIPALVTAIDPEDAYSVDLQLLPVALGVAKSVPCSLTPAEGTWQRRPQ